SMAGELRRAPLKRFPQVTLSFLYSICIILICCELGCIVSSNY
uniref:Uncharacterized protein n=1 Tax=Parascaris univalens TaxID=6257 RepID=A0A914ZWP8_PARUN